MRLIAILITIVIAVGTAASYRARHVHVDLYSTSVGIKANGDRILVHGKGDFHPGTRVIRTGRGGHAEVDAAKGQQRWLTSGSVPTAGGNFGAMSRDALLDINTLTVQSSGGLVAAWSDNWRYVWPRDAAFAAAALAETGHALDAIRNLEFLQKVQERDGTFHARYLPDGSGVPDDRGIQLDGTGWALWGSYWAIAHAGTPSEQRAAASRLHKLITKSTEAAMRLTANSSRLPPISSDYWETKESKLTLGTAAAILCGLRSASAIYQIAGDPRGATITKRADQVEQAIHRKFGPEGYPRTVGGQLDTAVAFLLPPFQPTAERGVIEAFGKAEQEMRRSAGGLAPGAGWKNDGISWTPETAVFALVSSYIGWTANAQERLDWLNDHRTTAGSIPEKVLHNGSPAAVAPLAWSAATVLLTISRICREKGEGCAAKP